MITLSTTLTVEVDLGVDDPHVTGEGVGARECLLFATVLTAHLLLLSVVDSILMSSKIVRAAKYAVAWLAGRRVGTCTLVRTLLRVSLGERCSSHGATKTTRRENR